MMKAIYSGNESDIYGYECFKELMSKNHSEDVSGEPDESEGCHFSHYWRLNETLIQYENRPENPKRIKISLHGKNVEKLSNIEKLIIGSVKTKV